MVKKSADFERNKGKIMQFRTKEGLSKGGKKRAENIRRKNAMREALELIMATKTDTKTAEAIRRQFPELKNTDIDGYIEVAALLRSHGRKNYQATIKMAEIMGGFDDKTEEQKNITIVVGNPEDAKTIAGI